MKIGRDAMTSIGAISSVKSSFGLYAAQQQNLTAQTKIQLQSLGIDTTNIKTEAQGQTALESSQESQQSQSTQQTENNQQSKPAGGDNSSADAIKEEAVALAQKIGASVSSNDELNDILDAISQAISKLQAQAVNDPQKAEQVAQYQAEFQSLCQSVSAMQSSNQESSVQTASSQIQASMNVLASYNLASISIANSGKLKS